MKIGLTGSIACGKSTVAAMIRQAGWPVADADAISRALTAPGGEALPLIRQAFGDAVFDGDVLNRRALGHIVFIDPEKRERLNAVLHPLIIERTLEQTAAADGPGKLSFADIPLLYECRLQTAFDRVWVVSAPRSAQLERLASRDGLSPTEAARRIDAQLPLCLKCRLADAVIDTSDTIEHTRAQILRLLSSLSADECCHARPAKEPL